jgi:hypothetical protein
MNNEWKEKTCEDCNFNIVGHCNKNPPKSTEGVTYYTTVSAFKYGIVVFMRACAEYKKREI